MTGPGGRTCVALAASLALLAGCATLPDVTPYRDATVQLRSTVLVGGHAVESGLLSAAASLDADADMARQIKVRTDQFAKDLRCASGSPAPRRA